MAYLDPEAGYDSWGDDDEQTVKNGNVEAAEQELASNVQVDETELILPYVEQLHSSTIRGDFETVKTLLEDARSNLVANGTAVFKKLVDHPNEDNFKRTALMEACEKGHLNLVQFLTTEMGADLMAHDSDDLQSTPIHLAAQEGHFDVVHFLLDYKPDLLEQRDIYNNTPLLMAAQAGHEKLVKFLADEKGADVTVKDGFGRTPLHKATNEGHYGVARFLVESAGFEKVLFARDSFLEATPIHLAALLGHLNLVQYFLEKVPDLLEINDRNKNTPICFAAQNGHLAIVEFLFLEKGAQIETRDQFGRTPLLKAAVQGHLDVVRFLAERCGADLTVRDSHINGAMAIHLAAECGHAGIVDYLLAKRPDFIDVTTLRGDSPLARAKLTNRGDVIALLLTKGARQ